MAYLHFDSEASSAFLNAGQVDQFGAKSDVTQFQEATLAFGSDTYVPTRAEIEACIDMKDMSGSGIASTEAMTKAELLAWYEPFVAPTPGTPQIVQNSPCSAGMTITWVGGTGSFTAMVQWSYTGPPNPPLDKTWTTITSNHNTSSPLNFNLPATYYNNSPPIRIDFRFSYDGGTSWSYSFADVGC